MRKTSIMLGLLSCNPLAANELKWDLVLEAGMLFQSKSDVQLPPDTGTRFSLVDAIGNGPLPYARFESKYALNSKHRLRMLIAPLAIEEQGQLNKDIEFNGDTFISNTETTYRYQFNSYRLSYAYRFFENSTYSWDAGFTAKIRDAEIALTQGNTKNNYPNIGFVPLLYVANESRIAPDWKFLMDLDASWSPYGRAFDLGLFMHYKIDKTWSLGFGYRTIEGGADVESVYNFAWFHYAGLRLQSVF